MLIPGRNGRRPPASTQEHVPVAMMRDGLIISRPIAPSRGVPYRIVARVLRVGVQEITRMSEDDRADFLRRYAAVVSRWRFPYQIIVTRERQDLDAFYRRLRRRAREARRREREIIEGLSGWMRRVTEQVNPQVPVYFIVVPHPTTALEGEGYEKAVKEVEDRARLIVNTLAPLGVPVAPATEDEVIRMLYEMYHPRLPNLNTSPRSQVLSLMARSRPEVEQR